MKTSFILIACLFALQGATVAQQPTELGKSQVHVSDTVPVDKAARPEGPQRYKPYKRAISFQVMPGINSDGGYFDGKVTALYGTPKVRVGIGAGYVSYRVRVAQESFILIARSSLQSLEFKVSFLPVYASFTVNLNRKQTVPYFSTDIGMSIPMTRHAEADATYYGNFFGIDTDTQGTLVIDEIKTGFYFACTFGVKYYFTPMIEAGCAVGFDASINSFAGVYTSSSTSQPQTTSYHSTHTSGGLTACLMIGFNLPFGQ